MKPNRKNRPIFISIGQQLTNKKQPIKQTYLYTQSQTTSNKPKQPPSLSIINQTQKVISNQRKLSMPSTNQYSTSNHISTMNSGMNDEFLFMRKENHLNTQFNIRKNRLKEITQENKVLYQRLNSQKSLYSSTDLNQHYEKNNQIQKRLSQSKLSQRLSNSRSSSRSSQLSKKGGNKLLNKKPEVKIEIKAANINNTQKHHLKAFQGLFMGNIRKSNEAVARDRANKSYNSFRPNQIYAKAPRMSLKNSIERNSTDEKVGKQSSLLHRIAEQMFEPKKVTKKLNYFSQFNKNKKYLNF